MRIKGKYQVWGGGHRGCAVDPPVAPAWPTLFLKCLGPGSARRGAGRRVAPPGAGEECRTLGRPQAG